MKRQALGRGLDALLPTLPSQATGPALLEIPIERISPNGRQPRVNFEPDRLSELAASLKEHGMLQPVVVRRQGADYELVAGERRWRAARQAGLSTIPALLQDVSDQRMLELALIENIQRDELSPIEEAHAYQLMLQEFGFTQEEVARRVGRSRTSITNTLRLLRLPKEVQNMVVEGHLSMGHARALLPLPRAQQIRLAKQVVRQGLSVRSVEKKVQRAQQPGPAARPGKDANVAAAERALEERWKARVELRYRHGKGRLTFFFDSPEELDRLYEALLKHPSGSA